MKVEELNKIRAALFPIDDATPKQIKKYVEPLKAAQADDVVKAIYKLLNSRPFVKWKDSIREVVGI